MSDNKEEPCLIITYGIELTYGDVLVRCSILHEPFLEKLRDQFDTDFYDVEEFIKEYNISSSDILVLLDSMKFDSYTIIESVLESMEINNIIDHGEQKIFLFTEYIDIADGMTKIYSKKLKKNIGDFKANLNKLKINIEPKLVVYKSHPN